MDCCFGRSGFSLSVAVDCYGLWTRAGCYWVLDDCCLGKSGLFLWVNGGFLWVIVDVFESWVLVAIDAGKDWRLGDCWVCFLASFDEQSKFTYFFISCYTSQILFKTNVIYYFIQKFIFYA